MQFAYRVLYYPIQLFLRLLIVYGLFSLCRLAFFLVNQPSFSNPSLLELGSIFLAGIRFDTSAIIYVNALLILSYILPFPFRGKKWYQIIQLILFITFNFFAILLELIDAGFFSYSFKRSVASDLTMIANSFQVTPRYLLDYWYLLFLLIGSVWGMYYLYQKFRIKEPEQQPPALSQWLIFLLAIPIGIIGARGGLQLRPVSPISAVDYVKDMRLAPLVTNTTLSIIFSSQQKGLAVPSYFTKEELSELLPPILPQSKDSLKKKNVVIIVLESFGKDQIGFFNRDKKSNTPFFDSLLNHSWMADNSFANGLRSTQGIVAITAGIPSLMEDPLMFSSYQGNQVNSLATYLNKKGYVTAFFHGSNPGSMEFERFTQLSGFQQFHDRTSYPDQNDYDGNWGIWDVPFFNFFSESIDDYSKPFLSVFFSLTSHHPYAVENWFEKEHPDMEKVSRSYLYTDNALRLFFEKAKNKPWFKKTLFILTADHVSPPKTEMANTRHGRYRIPIAFYDPSGDFEAPSQKVMQQIDILPTILDYLNYDEAISSFGKSSLKERESNYAYLYAEGLFQIMDEKYLLLFDGSNSIGLYDYIADPALRSNIINKENNKKKEIEMQIKAVIQKHHYEMVNNKLQVVE